METPTQDQQVPNPKVLVVDDTEDNLDLLEFALRKRPLTMLRANGGRECLKMAAAHDPDIAWQDVLWAMLNSKEFLFQH